MSKMNALLMILVVAAVTLFTRWLPFWLFGGKKVPALIKRLGRALPPAIMAALVVYCLKSAPSGTLSMGAAALFSVALVAVVQWFGKNTFISIALGTALYMVLLRMM